MFLSIKSHVARYKIAYGIAALILVLIGAALFSGKSFNLNSQLTGSVGSAINKKGPSKGPEPRPVTCSASQWNNNGICMPLCNSAQLCANAVVPPAPANSHSITLSCASGTNIVGCSDSTYNSWECNAGYKKDGNSCYLLRTDKKTMPTGVIIPISALSVTQNQLCSELTGGSALTGVATKTQAGANEMAAVYGGTSGWLRATCYTGSCNFVTEFYCK